MNDVPSPTAPPYAESLRTPWMRTLDKAYRVKAAEADELRAENVKLRVTIETLKRRLRDAARRQELWIERRNEWRAERARLIGGRK